MGDEIFTINNKHYLYIVDYHSKFPVIKQIEGFSKDNLIEMCKFVFSEYGLPSEIVSDVGTNLFQINSITYARYMSC